MKDILEDKLKEKGYHILDLEEDTPFSDDTEKDRKDVIEDKTSKRGRFIPLGVRSTRKIRGS